jgi:hypothetical protein
MTKPAVVLIGADKGGVGKTTVARTLLDFLAQHQIRTRAFDTEMPRGTLKRFHPDITDIVDINHVPDQMRIFDTVNSTDAAVSLIDIRSGLLSPTLRALHNIGFIDAAKKGEITLVVFHILGPSIASLDEIVETADSLRDAKYFMVKNFINNSHYFGWDDATHASYFKKVPDAVMIEIPKLVEMATEQVEVASVPFASFIANKNQSGDPASYSFVLRGYVRHWLDKVWAEYDRTGLLDILDAKQAPRAPAGKPRPVIKIAEAP